MKQTPRVTLKSRGKMLKTVPNEIGTIDRKGPTKANSAHQDYIQTLNGGRRIRQEIKMARSH